MSLLVSTYYDSANYHYGDLVFPLCSSGTAAVTSYSLWVYVDSGSMGTSGTSRLTFYNTSGTVVSTTTPSTPLPSGGWVNLTGPVSGGPVQASKVQIRFQPTTFDTYGSGRLWIDDIEWK
jgi:hypothetical protein